MAFLSELIGKPVTDLDGKEAGTLKDILTRKIETFAHPVVNAIEVERSGKNFFVPYHAIAVLIGAAIPLKQCLDDIQPYQVEEQDIFLSRDVLDKQIIDTDGARVVRVNDVELVRVNGDVVVSNVDVGILGIARRMGLAKAVEGLVQRLKINLSENYIAWDDVELLRYDNSMRLKVPREKISELHPADVAEILSDLNKHESSQILDSLDMEHLADALENVETDFQVRLVEHMSDEKVADVLEEMEPDEAADLLAELPEERSHDILALMEKEEAEDVRLLLSYPEESAGGIMTTGYVVVGPDLTAEQVIQVLRETGEEAETIFYIYVVDSENTLVGVISLKQLILAQPSAQVLSFMHKKVISVGLLDEQDEVAQVISKYDLLAVPVVDDDDHLQGIVTADDALDKIIPTAWKKRIPKFYR